MMTRVMNSPSGVSMASIAIRCLRKLPIATEILSCQAAHIQGWWDCFSTGTYSLPYHRMRQVESTSCIIHLQKRAAIGVHSRFTGQGSSSANLASSFFIRFSSFMTFRGRPARFPWNVANPSVFSARYARRINSRNAFSFAAICFSNFSRRRS